MGCAIRGSPEYTEFIRTMSQQDKRVRWSKTEIETWTTDNNLYCLSNQQVSALQTAIAVMSWKTRWIDGEEDWFSNFNGELALALMTPIDICNLISDCIENDGDLQQLIAQIAQANMNQPGDGYSPPPLPPAQTAANLLPDGYTCDTDHLCGMARHIVNSLHSGTQQLLQQLENATQQFEFISVFVDNFEVASWFGSALELATWLQDQLAEYYELAWSETIEDELTCDIYCQIEPNCEVTVDGLISAYESAVQESFSLPLVLDVANDLFDWLDALDYETAAAKAIVGSFHWFTLQALRFGSSAAQYVAGIRSFEQMVATGADETDTYCTVSPCDCTPPAAFEIGPPDCSTSTIGGVLEHLGGTRYRITYTSDGTNWRATVRRTGGGNVTPTNWTHINGSTSATEFNRYCDNGDYKATGDKPDGITTQGFRLLVSLMDSGQQIWEVDLT